jgi:hypothetical protein
MAQKCFPFNEFGPSVLKGTSAFLQNSTCVHGRSAPRHRCFPDGAIPGGLQELSPVSKRPRMADSTPDDRRIAAAERLEVKHQRLASSCWPLTALRLLWNPLDQHGLTAVTLLGYEPDSANGATPLNFVSHERGSPQY